MTLPLPPGGQQTPPEPAAQPSQPQAPAGAPVPALPQQQAQQQPKPAYSFNTVEEAVAFANAQVEAKRSANNQAKETRQELTELKQQLDFLVAQQRLAQQQALAANVQLAAKTAGFRDPDFIYSAIASQLQYNEAGQPVNVQAVLDALKTNKPYLLEMAPTQNDQQQPPAQPGHQPQPQGQPTPQLPSQLQAPISPTIAQQPRTGLMNAPQSLTNTGGALDWATINQNIRNPAWVAQNEAKLTEFMSNPANVLNRPR